MIEDDYDSEFRFGDRPLEPLQSLDRAGRVIYVGSFSKTHAARCCGSASWSRRPRCGPRCAPPSGSPTGTGELPTQAALARFIDEGLLARHIRKATREYAARHALIVDALVRR